MFLYPVKYRITSNEFLVKSHEPCRGGDVSSFLSFDDFYQMFSSDETYREQMNDKVVYCIKNSTFSLYFVFSQSGTLHLFNSRAEVTRFLRH